MPPTDAALRAWLREKRWAFEAACISGPNKWVEDDALLAYRAAIRAAAHLGPDPVEQAVEAYRKAVVAYEARERTGQGIYWEHLEPILAAKKALDAAILGEANEDFTPPLTPDGTISGSATIGELSDINRDD